MALRSDLSGKACPIARSVDILGDPWVALILREVFGGNRRFDGIVAGTGAAESVVSSRLTMLVERGLLDKRPYDGQGRRRDEYVLTDAGADTLPILHALARWGNAHAPAPDPVRRMRVFCLTCGGEPPSADWCPTCGRALTVETTGWRKARTPEVLVRLAEV